MPLSFDRDQLPIWRDERNRNSLLLAGGVHLALVIALSLSIRTPPPRPQTGMQVTFVELGDVPPNGDPNGDSAPPRPSEAEAIEAKEEPNKPTDKHENGRAAGREQVGE